MSVNCSVLGCNEPVIGQCHGYKCECGRFYCRTHSVEKLCDECATIKKADELMQLYDKTARSVKPSFWKYLALGYFGIWGGIGSLGMLMLYPVIAPVLEGNSQPSLSTLAVLMAFILLIIYLTFTIPMRMYKKVENEKLKKAANELENFEAYYLSWKKNEMKSAYKIAGMIALGVVIAGVAGSMDNSTRRDINDLNNRLSRLE